MEYKRLSDCASWGKDRTDNINYESYISTENMIKDKGGVTIASSLPDSKTASAYRPSDILLSNIRPYFRKIWYADKNGSCSNDVLVVRANEDIDSKFLYYVLSDNNFFNYDTVTSKGTKMPRGTQTAIMKYLVPDINIGKQRKIANILSTYDNLIENNNKRIKLLEQMAENLYKEWFVRFRFPGYEDVEFENGLPKDWKYTKLERLANISTGKCNREDAEEDGAYPLFDRSQEIKRSNVWLKDCEAIIVPGEGTSFIPRYYNGKFNLHQRCYCVEPLEKGMGFFLYQTLMMYRIYFLYVATGATVPSLRLNNFNDFKVLLPKKELCSQYNEIAEKMNDEILLLKNKNELLEKQRDMLLPRLMSGKLEV